MDLRSGRSCRFQAFNSQVLAERLDAQACRSRCRAEHVKSDGQQTLAAVCVGSSVENVFVADLVGVRKDCCSYQAPLHPPTLPCTVYTPLHHLIPPYTPLPGPKLLPVARTAAVYDDHGGRGALGPVGCRLQLSLHKLERGRAQRRPEDRRRRELCVHLR